MHEPSPTALLVLAVLLTLAVATSMLAGLVVLEARRESRTTQDDPEEPNP